MGFVRPRKGFHAFDLETLQGKSGGGATLPRTCHTTSAPSQERRAGVIQGAWRVGVGEHRRRGVSRIAISPPSQPSPATIRAAMGLRGPGLPNGRASARSGHCMRDGLPRHSGTSEVENT